MPESAVGPSWVRYWRSPDQPLEAMHANFHRQVYGRHSHETYSFGVTEAGAQSFACRGSNHVSAAGMIMIFNPDEPHDGRAASDLGFNYRIVHLGPALLCELLATWTDRPVAPPLFAQPVQHDPGLARELRLLHTALTQPASALDRDERLTSTVARISARYATRPPSAGAGRTASPRPVTAVRDCLHADVARDVPAAELARLAGASRFAVYRAFRAATGMSPSEYQRQLRLRQARRLLARGEGAALVAAQVGFADQAHLTRWFVRHFGITPAAFQRATAPTPTGRSSKPAANQEHTL
jgi:AraC-like DNA-binding protein